jgi:hypothetical protein
LRTVNYKTHWSYLGPAIKKKNALSDFLLDVLYLMEDSGVIPPIHVLNEILRSGGNSGGMGPGTTWRGFEIKEVEYTELVNALLNINPKEARIEHPYVRFEHVIVDDELNSCTSHIEWLRKVTEKYGLR